MSQKLTPFSGPGKVLSDKALALSKALLAIHDRFYPFAAIYENGKVGCLFTDEQTHHDKESDTADLRDSRSLLEHLQWRIIDNITDAESFAILVYVARVETHNEDMGGDEERQVEQDAIVMTLSGPGKQEKMVIYPYYRQQERVFVAPPLVEK